MKCLLFRVQPSSSLTLIIIAGLLFIAHLPNSQADDFTTLRAQSSEGTVQNQSEVSGSMSAQLAPITDQDRAQTEIEKLDAEAKKLYRAGKYDQGIVLAQQAVEQSEKIFGRDHRLLATSLNTLANFYRAKAEFQKAETLYQRALAIQEKSFGPAHPDVATSLHNLALVYQATGDFQKADSHYQRALAIQEKSLGSEHLDVSITLNNLGNLYKNTGDYKKAEPLYLRALTIKKKVLGTDHPSVATSLTGLANLYLEKGDYKKAEPLYQEGLAIREKALGADHLDVANSLTNLALLYNEKGDYQRAEPLYHRALAIYEKSLGSNHPKVATCLNNLGKLSWDQGNYQQTEHYLQRALAIREKVLGPDHPDTAFSLHSLATLYTTKGDLQRAEPLHQRALAIREKVLGSEHPETAGSLNNLANLYWASEDYQRAEPLYLRALAIREKALGPDHPEVADTLNDLANLYWTKGDYQRAEPLYQRALTIREKVLGADHPATASNLNNLANLFNSLGNYQKAELLYRRALAIYEKSFGPDHSLVAANFNNLANMFHAAGNLPQAIQFQIRANDASESDLKRNLVAGSEQQKILYLKQTSSYTDATLALHLQSAPQSREARQAALTVLLRRKGRALDAMTKAIETLRQQQTPEIQQLLETYASLAGQISVLTLRGPDKQTPEGHLAYVNELENQKGRLEAEISTKSTEFKTQVTPITLENIQKQLPADGMLIEFTTYKSYTPKTFQFGTLRMAIYTLDRAGEIRWADLGPATPIEQAVIALRKAVSTPRTDLIKDVAPAAQALDRLVMKPVRALVGNTRHLLISPDGVLNLIPFAALMDEQGKFLVENYTLTYLTSGRDVLRLAVKNESQQPPLVITDPDYLDGTGPQMLGHQLGRLARLAGTRVEGEQLKAIFPTAVLKVRAEATEQDLKQVKRPLLVHIATHGYFLEDAPQTSETTSLDQFARNTGKASFDFEKERHANPLLRSMLFFAGANQGGTENNDGVMTALEAAQLNLWGTKLVVLSACDTGLGDVKNGDGVYGLRRALVLAGSEAQMMSLWPVSDQATRELMVDYYTRLKAGEGRSQALRNVQLKLLKTPRRQHPFYWASFIQSGEWTNLDGKK
ncbi:MAG: CHAT domain-containing protein [Acidobacteria bacterium]|nr:CHAT domain-containing protein [Acidobacteriota bacterium]